MLKLQSHWANLSEKKQKAARRKWAENMRSLARLARDRDLWNGDAELEAKWL